MTDKKLEIIDENLLIIYEHHPELEEEKGSDWLIFDTFERYPDGSDWSIEEATAWGNLYIKSINEKDAPYPPFSPGDDPIPKATREEQDLWEKDMIARGLVL